MNQNGEEGIEATGSPDWTCYINFADDEIVSGS